MVYVTQLIYIIEGQEKIFDEFEDVAIPAIQKYRGRLLFRLRPAEDAFVERNIEKPYEIHFVQFDTNADFERFMQDEERRKFLHLKEQSIRASLVIRGEKV